MASKRRHRRKPRQAPRPAERSARPTTALGKATEMASWSATRGEGDGQSAAAAERGEKGMIRKTPLSAGAAIAVAAVLALALPAASGTCSQVTGKGRAKDPASATTLAQAELVRQAARFGGNLAHVDQLQKGFAWLRVQDDGGGLPEEVITPERAGARGCRAAPAARAPVALRLRKIGGHARNRTGVHGFAVRCVTTPPRGLW
jgi:hypothetical protein